MKEITLGTVESRFAEIIWENEPLTSGDLVKLAEAQLNWKKSTTYTVLKKLCERGLFENNSGLVRALISHEEFHSMQSAFIAAFTSRKKLSDKEISEIKKMIESIKED